MPENDRAVDLSGAYDADVPGKSPKSTPSNSSGGVDLSGGYTTKDTQAEGDKEGLLDKADSYINNALAPNPQNYVGDNSFLKTNTREVPKTLGREVYSAGKTALGMIPGAYHAFADEATPEEKQEYSKFEQEHGEEPGTETSGLKRLGLGLHRLTGVDSAVNAAKTYANPETRPTLNQALDVMPEAIGQGAGTVVGGEALAKVAPKVPGAAKTVLNKTMQGVGKVGGAVLDNPEIAGATIGTAAGHGTFGGAYLGSKLGKFAKKVGLDSSSLDSLTYAGKSPEEINVSKLGDSVNDAQKEFDKAKKAHDVYAKSIKNGVDPPKNVVDAYQKAHDKLAEAHLHLDMAKEALKAKPQGDSGLNGPDQPITPEQVAKSTPKQLNAKPTELGPSTLESPLSEPPPVDATTRAQRKGLLLPEPSPALPEPGYTEPRGEPIGTHIGGKAAPFEQRYAGPKPIGTQEVLPPEAPNKPGRLGTLKAVEGKVVDTEDPIQQKIEEGLNKGSANAKPIALKPLGATESPLGRVPATLPSEYGPPKTDFLREHNGRVPDENLGFNPKPAEDVGQKVRGESPGVPRGERRTVERKPEDVETERLFKQARTELGDDATTDQVMNRVDELKREPKGEPEAKRSPEETTKATKTVNELPNQDLLNLGKEFGLSTSTKDYDFSRREALHEGGGKHPVDRIKFHKDTMNKLPGDLVDHIIQASEDWDKANPPQFNKASMNSKWYADRARAIINEALDRYHKENE